MSLSDLSREQLLEILFSMKEQSGLDPEALVKDIVSAKMRSITDTLHTIFCILPHDDNGCSYYREQSWSEGTKARWVQRARLLMQRYDVSEDTLQRALPFARDIQRILLEVEAIDFRLIPVIVDILKESEFFLNPNPLQTQSQDPPA